MNASQVAFEYGQNNYGRQRTLDPEVVQQEFYRLCSAITDLSKHVRAIEETMVYMAGFRDHVERVHPGIFAEFERSYPVARMMAPEDYTTVFKSVAPYGGHLPPLP